MNDIKRECTLWIESDTWKRDNTKFQVQLCFKRSLYLHPNFDKEQHANDSQKVYKGDAFYLGFHFNWRRYYSVILANFILRCLLSSQHENGEKLNRFLTYKGLNVMRCAIWCNLYNLKNVKNTHGELLILVKLQADVCKFTKINTPPWMLFTFLKLYKWYQIAQRTTNHQRDVKCYVAVFIRRLLNVIQLMHFFYTILLEWALCRKNLSKPL